ncbi:hypothetical protein CLV51_1011656 [Chitinophaga niastensis]|uniref:Uncharacterized protein n=1 Tax=Chitinophaga niastensis TaxID=536980 RepID=A0A2P8HVQ9_CHINA|nr:hypothetical protein [Chitinophaga niastensis]PSL50312.1 hypothetical protein CLV51_1011656 [Chitinophaga niastensis]
MKKVIQSCALIAFAIAILSVQVACKKDTKQNNMNTFEVEYRIVSVNSSFTRITYNDQTGTPVVLNDAMQFQNGVKKITVSAKPFTARLSTEVNNQTSTTFKYDLYISVDGQQIKSVSGSAPPMTPSTVTAVEYTVQ